jgi:putative membrane protein
MFRKSKEAARKEQEKRQTKGREVKLLGGFAAGVIAGLVATWVLDKYQQGALEATRRVENATNAGPAFSRQQEDQLREQQRAHAEAAKRIAKSTIGKKLSHAQQRDAAAIVQYAAGALAGGVYGVAAEILPGVRRWYGMGYSKAIFLGGSEPLLPWLGLSSGQKVQVTPAGLPAPLVFGVALETTRRVLRWML